VEAGIFGRTMRRLRSRQNGEAPPDEALEARSTRLTAGQIYDNVRVAAQQELRRLAAALFWSATAAGLTIGFSFLAGAYLMGLVPAAYSGAATAVGYPLGFVFVVLARGQLFTENTLEPIIPLLHSPTLKTLRQLISLWVVVLIGNLAGALAFAAIVALTPMLSESLRPMLIAVAKTGTDGGFWLVALRAIYAGWLIALMAWADCFHTRHRRSSPHDLDHHGAYFGAGFRHSVAGSVEAFYRAFEHTAGWREMAGSFIVPAVVGNIIGGFVFVALLNHGQVAADRAGDT
jgi:formate-nitrite transporter family protein